MNQQASNNIMTLAVKETWVNALTSAVRHHLKDVKKGWFNIEESNLEVYTFSKLRKFMYRINFAMEDVLRDMMYRMVADYTKLMKQFCPDSVTVIANDNVSVKGGKFPLFTVDLKFINATPQVTAKFIYSATVETLFAAIMAPFEQSFKNLKGITKVERRVMKKLFWAYDPVIGVPHISEDWALELKRQLESNVKYEKYYSCFHENVILRIIIGKL
jgi:dynein heavy chain